MPLTQLIALASDTVRRTPRALANATAAYFGLKRASAEMREFVVMVFMGKSPFATNRRAASFGATAEGRHAKVEAGLKGCDCPVLTRGEMLQ
jgi:hypothetical protein